VTERQAPRIALLVSQGSETERELSAAVQEGGGVLSELDQAQGVIWTDPRDPEGLRAALESSPARWVQLPFAGVEPFIAAGVIDAEREWTCAKGIYGESCAEHALAFMLMAAHRMHVHLCARSWLPESGERRFHGRTTVVIVGTGGIGRSLARMLVPLEARVIGVNRSGRPLEGAESTVPTEELAGVLPEADFAVVAAALTPETRRLFDAELIGRLRQQAWLVNVARGPLVDTDALVEALASGRLGGAALDVTDPEPLPEGHPLWSLENALITPHVANTWTMGLPALRALVARNVKRFASNEDLEGRIDVGLGY
jgi:phosphoglycerate dehydrogenase-like enzyme